MTRLITSWVSPMLTGMKQYNDNLKKHIGLDLCGLMADIYGVDEKRLAESKKELVIGVIPITQGEGIISDFTEAVASILASMEFNAFVTTNTDVNGIYEAYNKGANVLFFADDDRYIALNIRDMRIADNNYCTALGYITVLDKLMRKSGKDMSLEKILVIGYGIVGKEAVKLLKNKSARFAVYDKDKTVFSDEGSSGIDGSLDFEILESYDDIKKFKYILDFTNEGEWLKASDINPDTIYSSPGVPCSLDKNAKKILEKTAIYDNLEIGTCVMLGEAVF